MKGFAFAALAATMVCAGVADAATVDVTPSAMSGWTIPFTETGIYGGTAAITGTAARSGDGSLELSGPRSRAVIGRLYGAVGPTLAALSDVQSLTFDWQVATGSATSYSSAVYTPALRLIISDGVANKKELIWEGAYNNTYTTTSQGNWYTSGASDNFYITGGNVNDGKSIAQWVADSSLAGWNVIGISVGHGGGAAGGYHAFADNVTFATTSGSTTYNFNVTADVPEPATWAMFIGGFGMIGGTMRRSRRTSVRFA